ncbi:MAG: hypothetical protein HWQ39_05055 [Nostoc sp. NMS8]|nr:hypothetical protein [Nostoc sp. NMS8]
MNLGAAWGGIRVLWLRNLNEALEQRMTGSRTGLAIQTKPACVEYGEIK